MKAREFAARGALAGALGGLVAGAVDFSLASRQAAAFLPSGRAGLRASAGAMAAGWGLGLVAGAGAIAFLMLRLQAAPRLTHPMRALDLALWAPALLIATGAAFHFLFRLAGRRGPRSQMAFTVA